MDKETQLKQRINKLENFVRLVVEDYDNTGCEKCGVINESTIEVAKQLLKESS